MKIKNQLELASKIINLPIMLLMTAGYSVVYGILFGIIFLSGTAQGILFQTCMWFLFYGYIFFGFAGGVGIIYIFYALLSFGKDRKTAFLVWSKTVLLTMIFAVLALIPSIVSGRNYVEKDSTIIFYGINFNPRDFIRLSISTESWKGLGMILLLIGIGAFLNILIAFFCTVGMRFGWQVTVATVLLTFSLMMVLFVADINILFATGHNILQYLLSLYAFSAVLYGGIYFLSQKWEVKN